MAELLRTEGLSKRFRGLVANDAIDFTLQEGEVRCVIGPNGAGKTTFISMVSGHLSPSSGRIVFRGRDVTHTSVPARAQMGIARKFQTPSVFDRLSVYANLELASFGKPASAAERERRIAEALELTRLVELRALPASALSHGQRQWLEVGMLLANRAELLLLDEPTAGMTAEETRATGELIRTLADTHRLSVIIIEHDIAFIRELKAPVTVLHLGRVLMTGPFEAVAQDERVRSVYLGKE
ncbi:MAG: ATP-binding cassette domain-containing protein [Acidobacteriia bacterium]|nr:ATP-binding cassette domain-containing protein [Methyloceanibacter sp.]MBX5471022.1 ATP-binding cassette domain-containing protein [Acetobacteraceae bacterium]MCL6490945.1 ATP-binding cassette domain-containing protein [Terriglobia bacterium]